MIRAHPKLVQCLPGWMKHLNQRGSEFLEDELLPPGFSSSQVSLRWLCECRGQCGLKPRRPLMSRATIHLIVLVFKMTTEQGRIHPGMNSYHPQLLRLVQPGPAHFWTWSYKFETMIKYPFALEILLTVSFSSQCGRFEIIFFQFHIF